MCQLWTLGKRKSRGTSGKIIAEGTLGGLHHVYGRAT